MGMEEEEQVETVYPHGWWILPGIMLGTPFCVAACIFVLICLKGG